MNIFKVAIVASIALSSPAVAQNFVELGESGEWTVIISEGTDDRSICSLSSTAPEEDIAFFMNSYPDGSYSILITNTASDISGAPILHDVILEMTHPMMSEEWNMRDAQFLASDDGFSITFFFGERVTPHKFFRDFSEGYNMHLIINDKKQQTWSLYGASKAVDLFNDCHELIMGER
jgi:hypothetical protein